MSGLSPEVWTAIGTIGLALLTAILVAVGLWQVFSITRENMKSRTISVCDRYDNDPVLDNSLRNIYRAKISDKPVLDMSLKTDIANVLNYLDSICIGIQQGIYIESLVKDHMRAILLQHFDEHVHDTAAARRVGIDPNNYEHLKSVAMRWKNDTPHTSYRDTKWKKQGQHQ